MSFSFLLEEVEIQESLNEYIEQVGCRSFLVYKYETGEVACLFSLKPTSPFVLEIYVCDVKSKMHRKGVGRVLLEAMKSYALANEFCSFRDYSFMMVTGKSLSSRCPKELIYT